jgi:hypothetical protein
MDGADGVRAAACRALEGCPRGRPPRGALWPPKIRTRGQSDDRDGARSRRAIHRHCLSVIVGITAIASVLVIIDFPSKRSSGLNLRSRLQAAFSFSITTHKEAAKVTPDGSHLARCVVIAYEAHAATWLATTAALVADPKGTTVHIIIRSVTDTRQEH